MILKGKSYKTIQRSKNARRTTTKDILFLVGGVSRGGTYILRIRVRKSLRMSFGRFKGGKIISVAAGDYCYIGSALSTNGATCLARRLVRHATRLGNNPPHAIRRTMLSVFLEAELADRDLLPKGFKRPHWNVDHLLDKPTVDLVAAYLIRSPVRLEAVIGKWLEHDPATVVFEEGLGANDVPGNTHLLRVEAGEDWWRQLPARLEVQFLGKAR